MGVPDKVGELAGSVIGAYFGVLAKDFDLPGLQKGAMIGWGLYFVSLLVYWSL